MTLIVVSLGSLFYSIKVLGLARSLGLGTNGLEQEGSYRKVRNPQAQACSVYVTGFTVLWLSWYAAGWTVLYWILIYILVFIEEEHLLNTYGDSYLKYCQEVPRFFSIRTSSDNAPA
jgi:protein-S-isoprenylcysteine O-methyltransferase Ste14